MYTTPLSPVLAESLNNSTNGCISSVDIKDELTLNNYVNEKILSSLSKGQHSLIVLDTMADQTIIAKQLSKYRIAHFVTQFSGQQPLSPKLVERLKILSNLEKLEGEFNIDDLEIDYHRIDQKIKSAYQSINRNVFGNLNFKATLAEVNRAESHPLSSKLKRAIAQLNDRDTVIDHMSQLHFLYNSRFVNIDTISKLSTEAFRSFDHVQLAQGQLQQIVSQLETLRTAIQRRVQIFDKQIENAIIEEKERWEQLMEEIQGIYSQCDTKGVELDYVDRVRQITQNHDLGYYFRISQWTFAELTWQNSPVIFKEVRTELSRFNEIIAEQQLQCIKRLTPFNAPDDELKSLIHELYTIADQVNSSEYLDLKLQDNALTVDNQINELTTCISVIKASLAPLGDDKYVAYKLLSNQLLINEEISEHLITHGGSNWENAFLKICLQADLQESYNTDLRQLNILHDRILSINEQRKNGLISYIHNKWCDIRRDAMDHLPIGAQPIIDDLLSNYTNATDATDLFRIAPSFTQSYMPIVVCSVDQFGQLINGSNQWDNISIINTNLSDSLFGNIHLEATNLTLINSQLTIEDKTRDITIVNHKDDSISLTYMKPFELSDYSEKILQARSIANALLKVVESYDVFKVGTKTIISFISEPMRDILLDRLPHQQLNMIYEQTASEDDLVEALIVDDFGVSILHENGIFNDRQVESHQWQRLIFNQLQEAGIPLIDFATNSLFINFDRNIDNLISQITANSMTTVHRVSAKSVD